MELTLTAKDYKAQVLYFYYLNHRRWKYYRPILGIACILLGINFISTYNDKFFLAYGGFAFGFGLYYLLNPLLYIWINRKKFKSVNFFFEFEGDELFIKDQISEAKFNLNLYPLQSNSKYYFIKIGHSQRLFFPKYKLNKEQTTLFDERIKNGD